MRLFKKYKILFLKSVKFKFVKIYSIEKSVFIFYYKKKSLKINGFYNAIRSSKK